MEIMPWGVAKPDGNIERGSWQRSIDEIDEELNNNELLNEKFEKFSRFLEERNQTLTRENKIKKFMISVLGYIVIGDKKDVYTGPFTVIYPKISRDTKNKATRKIVNATIAQMETFEYKIDSLKDETIKAYEMIEVYYCADRVNYREPEGLEEIYENNTGHSLRKVEDLTL